MSSPSPSDPFAVDRRFQAVFDRLHAPAATDRGAVLQALALLPDPPVPGADPYLLELAGPLAKRAERMDPVGVAPERLVGAADRLRRWEAACPELRSVADWTETIRRLCEGAAQLFVYAGDPVQAARTMLPDRDAAAGLVPVLTVSAEADPAAVAEAFLDAVDLPDAALEPIRAARTALRTETPGVGVPVVERPARDASETPTRGVGGLLRLRVTQVQSGEDARAHGVRIRGLDALGRDRLVPVERAVAATAGGIGDTESIQVWVKCTPAGAPVVGTSLQLGLGGLVLARVAMQDAPRVQLRMASGTALTGGLDADGRADLVAPETLAVKVQAAFFSPVTVLAVPHGQEAAAEAARDRLHARFPRGALHIVGVRALRDVLDRRRLTRRTEVGRVRHAAQKATDRMGVWGLAVLAVCLAAGLVYTQIPPFDTTPARGTYSGSTLTVENREGRVIDRVTVGSNVVNGVQSKTRAAPHAFLDPEGDGTAGMAWAVSFPGEGEAIRARALRGDTLWWERPATFSVGFPEKPFASRPVYQVESIYAADTRGGPEDELYALLTHSPYFPGLLVELDPRTGAVLQQYVHPGHLTARIRHADLDGDGTVELITGGYSNAYESPVVIALDAENFEGHAPATPAYTPDGFAPAAHHEYLRLPATPVQRAAPKTFRMVRATRRFGRRIQVQVEDGTWNDAHVSETELFVDFGFDLRPRSVGTNSQHDRLAERLVETGRLEAVPGREALQAYREGIRYWNGDGWQATPVHSTP